MNFKRFRRVLYDVVYVFLTLLIMLGILVLNAAFIANIANSLRMTSYLDPVFGIQVILVLISLVYIPLAIFVKHLGER